MDAPYYNGGPDDDLGYEREPRPESLYVVCEACDTTGEYEGHGEALDDGWLYAGPRWYCLECQTHGGPIRRTP